MSHPERRFLVADDGDAVLQLGILFGNQGNQENRDRVSPLSSH